MRYAVCESTHSGALCRGTLEKRRHNLGRDHFETFFSFTNLAAPLKQQGKHAEAVEIERKVLVSTTRLLGPEHEQTLISASNLALPLSQCGMSLRTEAGQVLRETLALSRRAPDPAREVAQHLLQGFRMLGLAA